MHHISGATPLGDIVAHDLRTGAVFNRHGLDFCCGGRITLADACRTREIDPDVLLAELRAVGRDPDPPVDVTTWPVEQVIERIVGRHHAYVRRQIPVITAYLERLVVHHGEGAPELSRLAMMFGELAGDLERHMQREELVLFPFIEAMAAAERTQSAPPPAPFGSVTNPIRVMEDEHQSVAAELWLMRVLSNGYTAPEHACATWGVCYEALTAFEHDLQQHVHLENNVVFPEAMRLELGRSAVAD